MLEQMRNSSGSLLIWVLFAIIIAAFVLFFGSPSDSLGCGSNNDYSIKVEDEPVSVHSWRFAYNGMPLLYGNVPGNQRRPMALEFLLQREILAQAAEDMDFQISDEILDEAIGGGDFYLFGNKMDGTGIYFENSEEGFFFDFDRLQNLVKGRLGLPSMQVYRGEQRREMLAYFMKQEVMQSAYVSEEEARETFIRSNTTVSANYVKFEVAKYRSGLKLSEADVQGYADSHGDELAKEWDQVKTRWESDEARVRARIIKVTKKPSPPETTEEGKEGKEAANPVDLGKTVIDAALARIEGGESFAAVASDVSEDRSASLGGAIGWRAATSMGYGQEVVDATKDLKVDKVSKVIENSLFYYLVLVEKRSDKGLTLEDKKFDLAAKAAPEETAKKRAKAAAEAALASAQTTPLNELFKAAAPSGIPNLNDLPPEIREQLTPEQIEKLMKGMVPGSQSGAIVTEGRTRLADQGGAEAEPAATEVPTPAAGAPNPTSATAPPPKAKPATAKPKPATAKPKPATPATKPTGETEAPAPGAGAAIDSEIPPPSLQTIAGTTRNGDFIAGLGRSKKLVSDIFGTLDANSLAPEVYEVAESDGYVVIHLTDRSEADMEAFKEEAASLQETLSQAKGVERLQAWLLKSCLSLKGSDSIKPNYSLLVAGSDSKQIPYEPCSSLEASP